MAGAPPTLTTTQDHTARLQTYCCPSGNDTTASAAPTTYARVRVSPKFCARVRLAACDRTARAPGAGANLAPGSRGSGVERFESMFELFGGSSSQLLRQPSSSQSTQALLIGPCLSIVYDTAVLTENGRVPVIAIRQSDSSRRNSACRDSP